MLCREGRQCPGARTGRKCRVTERLDEFETGVKHINLAIRIISEEAGSRVSVGDCQSCITGARIGYGDDRIVGGQIEVPNH